MLYSKFNEDKYISEGFESGCIYTSLIYEIALNNLYRFTDALEKIEAEVQRIDDEVRTKSNGNKKTVNEVREFEIQKLIQQYKRIKEK